MVFIVSSQISYKIKSIYSKIIPGVQFGTILDAYEEWYYVCNAYINHSIYNKNHSN